MIFLTLTFEKRQVSRLRTSLWCDNEEKTSWHSACYLLFSNLAVVAARKQKTRIETDRNMNRITKLLSLAAFVALGTTQTWADQTNLIQDLNIQLLGYKQGSTSTNRNTVTTSLDAVRVSNRDVIAALGTATGTTFSKSAKLVIVTPLPSGTPVIQVRDSGNSVDVTSYLSFTQQGNALTTSRISLRNSTGSSTVYSVQSLSLIDPTGGTTALRFTVQGVAESTAAITSNAVPDTETDATVTGVGESSDTTLILQGAVRISGHKVEVVSYTAPLPT
jgi:hypothetical protein